MVRSGRVKGASNQSCHSPGIHASYRKNTGPSPHPAFPILGVYDSPFVYVAILYPLICRNLRFRCVFYTACERLVHRCT